MTNTYWFSNSASNAALAMRTLTNLTNDVVAPQFRSNTVAVRFPSSVTASLRIVFEQSLARSQPMARQAPQAISAAAARHRIHRVTFIVMDDSSASQRSPATSGVVRASARTLAAGNSTVRRYRGSDPRQASSSPTRQVLRSQAGQPAGRLLFFERRSWTGFPEAPVRFAHELFVDDTARGGRLPLVNRASDFVRAADRLRDVQEDIERLGAREPRVVVEPVEKREPPRAVLPHLERLQNWRNGPSAEDHRPRPDGPLSVDPDMQLAVHGEKGRKYLPALPDSDASDVPHPGTSFHGLMERRMPGDRARPRFGVEGKAAVLLSTMAELCEADHRNAGLSSRGGS